MSNEKDRAMRTAAAQLGAQLRDLADAAANFIRESDQTLIALDSDDVRAVIRRMNALQVVADRLALECDRYRAARDTARQRLAEAQSEETP
jgi:hypothetical protein